jgi:(E)-4-hydroxy-3-methylbut-2-enyl-diphosphate synthase
MTNVHTHDVDACVAQIERLVKRGCEIVRVAVPMEKDTAALKDILAQVSVPVVADVHFHYQRAIEAVEAGVAKIRLNPGNIQDRKQVDEVIAACKAHGTAIRVGVNEGSIVERKDKDRQAVESQQDLVALMTAKLAEYVTIFEDAHFEALVLSAKCHDAARTVAVNRAIAARFDYPLHLGVTHAGDVQTGSVRSAAALGALLADGIGDTLRVSLAGDPVEEVGVAWEVLASLGLRPRRGPELIACPTCGRTEIDLLAMVAKVKAALAEIEAPLVVAVMGCVVNGPGEAQDADVALCGGKDRAVIYCRGEKIGTFDEALAIEKLIEQVHKLADSQQTG